MRLAIVICLVVLCTSLVWAECSDGTINTDPCGYRVNSGGMQQIETSTPYTRIWNDGARHLFVPSRTSSELNSFINNQPGFVTVRDCVLESDWHDDVCCSYGRDAVDWWKSGGSGVIHCCPQKTDKSCFTRTRTRSDACCGSANLEGYYFHNSYTATVQCCS